MVDGWLTGDYRIYYCKYFEYDVTRSSFWTLIPYNIPLLHRQLIIQLWINKALL